MLIESIRTLKRKTRTRLIQTGVTASITSQFQALVDLIENSKNVEKEILLRRGICTCGQKLDLDTSQVDVENSRWVCASCKIKLLLTVRIISINGILIARCFILYPAKSERNIRYKPMCII
ncbi:hypothetical protein C4569_00820, partial [Candidatus Parcubacteria bacterium]